MQDFSVFIANHMGLSYALAAVIVLLLIIEALRARRATFRVDVSRAIHLINRENAVIIDIRSTELYRKEHMLDAVSISASEISIADKKLEKLKKKPLIIVCTTGMESQKIAALLLKKGYNAHSLNGGIRAWQSANMPMVKDEKHG